MNLNFDLEHVKSTEFGVGFDDGRDYEFIFVPVDGDVKTALQEMVVTTWCEIQEDIDNLRLYDPSEKQSENEPLFLPATDEKCQRLSSLHKANNLLMDYYALDTPNKISCYFARLHDKNDNRLTTVRRAIQFKGDLKKKLISISDGTLKILENKVFRLDSDFDLIIDSDNLFIWRPSAFEFLCKLQKAILDAVPSNIDVLSKDMQFVEFDNIQTYAVKHPRAARYLASITTHNLAGITLGALIAECQKTNVKITVANDKVRVDEGNILNFLEVLDRRRYEIELVPDNPELFRATGRQKI